MSAPAPEPAPVPSGDASELQTRIYDELRALAARKLASEPPGQTLQATALVHEAWLRLAAGRHKEWNGHTHFYAAAARAMREILIDNARRKRAARHGGGWLRIDLPKFEIETLAGPNAEPADSTDALLAALDRLASSYPQHVELVQLRFFAGLTLRQAATALGISEPTAKRHWAFARAWLFRQLHSDPSRTGSAP